jgi:hypothetical protein
VKSIHLNYNGQREVSLKDHTTSNSIRIVKFTSERLDTFPLFIEFIWNYPNGEEKRSGQSPEVYITVYHREPVGEVWDYSPMILDDVQFLKMALDEKTGLTHPCNEPSNCTIFFEEF